MVASPQTLVSFYLSQCQGEGCSERTLVGYGDALTRFLLDTRLVSVDQITVALAVEWSTALLASTDARSGRRLKTGTVATYQRRVWSWFRWLYEHDFVHQDISTKVKKVRVADVTRRSVSVDAKEKLEALARGKRENAARDAAIIEMLFGTALRRAELASLNLCDVDFEAGTVNVLGKGNKRRVIGISAAARTALWAYRAEKRGDDAGPLFLGRDGTRLSSNAIRLTLSRIGARAETRLGAHDFRRGAAAHMLEAGMRETSAMHQMGHSGVSMLRMYAKESEERRALAEFHALDKKRSG